MSGPAPAAPASGLLRVHRNQADRGAALIEYMFLLSLVVVVAIGALVYLGGATEHLLNNSVTVIRQHVQ